jgi:PAS domain S-box-containing protein
VSRLPAVYFEQLLEDSPDIIVAVDRHGIITFYNDGARQTLGYSPGDVLGQHVTRLYPDLAEARKVMDAMKAGQGGTGRVRNFDTTFVTKTAERIPVAISGSIIGSDASGPAGSIGFAKDLREIRRHDRAVTLAEVAVGLAHEINNPLEVLVNNLNLSPATSSGSAPTTSSSRASASTRRSRRSTASGRSFRRSRTSPRVPSTRCEYLHGSRWSTA